MSGGSLGDMSVEDVRCKETTKLLAHVDRQGMYLYCKICKMEHLILWDELRSKMAREGEQIGVTSGFVL